MQLQELLKTKDNNFKLIRMLAACLVVYSHSFCLATGNEHSEPIAQYLGLSLGYIAVDIFFITSGLLVCKSLLTARSLTIFVLSRCLRIYPALITSVIFCCLLGLQLSKLSLGQYLSHNETQNFLIYNSSIIVGDYQMLPDVFTSAPYNRSVNGSLWTLPWELKMYLILTGFGVTYQFARKLKVAVNWLPTVIVLTALICLMLFIHDQLSGREPHWFYSKFYRFASAFFIGGNLYVFRAWIGINYKGMLAAILILLLAFFSLNQSLFFISYLIITPYLIMCFAYLPKGKILHYNHLGDYSYGMYIYAWPIQQLIATTIPKVTAIHMFVMAFCLTLLLAYCSWNYIEKPALALKRHLYQPSS